MLKKKNIYVISITVLIVFLIIVSAFLGLIIYMQWRQLNFTISYYDTLEKFDTISGAKNITVGSVKMGLGFEGLPFVEGRINNNGKGTVVSITLKINFLDSANKEVYSYIAYPLEPFHPKRIFKKMYLSYIPFPKVAAIRPNGSALIKCTIWGCPRKYIKMLKRHSFSNTPGEWCGNVSIEVIRIRLKAKAPGLTR